jgi:hypothetical protein
MMNLLLRKSHPSRSKKLSKKRSWLGRRIIIRELIRNPRRFRKSPRQRKKSKSLFLLRNLPKRRYRKRMIMIRTMDKYSKCLARSERLQRITTL